MIGLFLTLMQWNFKLKCPLNSTGQVNSGSERSMEMPPKSLATSINKPCCHFDSALTWRVTGWLSMTKLQFIEGPSDGLTIMIISSPFHNILNLLKLSFICCNLLGLKLHWLTTNILYQTKLNQTQILGHLPKWLYLQAKWMQPKIIHAKMET